MRTLSIAVHLSVDELEQRYRTAHDSVARSQWQIIWLHAQGQSVQRIAEVTSYSTNGIY